MTFQVDQFDRVKSWFQRSQHTNNKELTILMLLKMCFLDEKFDNKKKHPEFLQIILRPALKNMHDILSKIKPLKKETFVQGMPQQLLYHSTQILIQLLKLPF